MECSCLDCSAPFAKKLVPHFMIFTIFRSLSMDLSLVDQDGFIVSYCMLLVGFWFFD